MTSLRYTTGNTCWGILDVEVYSSKYKYSIYSSTLYLHKCSTQFAKSRVFIMFVIFICLIFIVWQWQVERSCARQMRSTCAFDCGLRSMLCKSDRARITRYAIGARDSRHELIASCFAPRNAPFIDSWTVERPRAKSQLSAAVARRPMQSQNVTLKRRIGVRQLLHASYELCLFCHPLEHRGIYESPVPILLGSEHLIRIRTSTTCLDAQAMHPVVYDRCLSVYMRTPLILRHELCAPGTRLGGLIVLLLPRRPDSRPESKLHTQNYASHWEVAASISFERTSRVPPPVDHSKKSVLHLSRFTKHPSMWPPPSSSASATSTTIG